MGGAVRATLRDLMDRMGHASTKAALIYLHMSGARDKAIADALSAMVEQTQQKRTTRKINGQAAGTR